MDDLSKSNMNMIKNLTPMNDISKDVKNSLGDISGDVAKSLQTAMLYGVKAKIPTSQIAFGSLADNSLTCDAAGNCMIKPTVVAPTRTPKSGTTLIVANGAKAVYDSAGNVMMGDKLVGSDRSTWAPTRNYADNSLTCDSAGNCMLKDSLAGSDRRTWTPTD